MRDNQSGLTQGVRLAFGSTVASSALLVILVVAGGLLPMLLFGKTGSQIATVMMIQLCAVLGLAVFTGNTGVVSFGHAALVGLGAYVAGILTMNATVQVSALPNLPSVLAGHQLPLVLALLASALVGALFGAVSGLPFRRLAGEAGAIATLAVLIIVNTVLVGARDFTRGSQTFYGVPRETTLVLAIAVACLFAVFARIIRDTPFGLALRSTRDDEIGAASIGVAVRRSRYFAWIISAAMTSLAGALYGGFLGAFSPRDFSFDFTFLLLAMLIVGGIYSVTGAVVGTMLLTIVIQVARLGETGINLGFITIPGLFGLPLLGVSIALMLTIWRRPNGLLGLSEIGTKTSGTGSTSLASPIALGRPLEAEKKMSGASLIVDDVTVRFGGLTAVDKVSFSVTPGTAVGLIGPNGAGKTTLINTICGQGKTSAGRVMLGDFCLSELPTSEIARSGLARTFQNIRLFDRMTVFQNVLAAASRKHGLSQAIALTERELARMQLGKLRDRFAGTLSYGDRRRLEIARALALEPRFLFLDEPAAGMNPKETDDLFNILIAVRRDVDLGLVVIEHDLHFIMRLCDRIIVLDKGRKLADGTADEVRSDPAVIAAYLGTKNPNKSSQPERSQS